MHSTLKRWGIPVVVALVVMVGYQLIIAPTIGDWLADWSFLHAARIQLIQQQRQAQQPK